MPSPFPGMDPYLEYPGIFPDLHDSLIVYLKESIQPRLPVPYFASIGARIWVEKSDRPLGPDVRIHRQGGGSQKNAGGGTALLQDLTIKPVVFHVPFEEIKETYLEIFKQSKSADKELITSIEILSPSNKAKGKPGRKKYLLKQREMLRSGVNLVEIDLLRGGTHSTAVPLDWALAETGGFDYHVSVRRPARSREYVVYPIRLTASLPSIGIPLLADDGEVKIDLQTLFAKAYDVGNYERQKVYDREISGPDFTPAQNAWATKILTEHGFLAKPRPRKK